MSLIDTIRAEMDSDDEDIDKQSARLIQDYLTSSPAQQDAIDRALICICGWSMPTLLNMEGSR